MEGALPKLLLIGANGSVGKFLVKHLAPKYAVSALLRSAPKFDVSLYPTLKIIEGDASSQQTLNDAFKGVDVVVSSYQNFKAGPTDMHDFVVRVIHAMKENNVKRFIFVTGYGLLKTSQGTILKDSEKFPPQYKDANDDSYKGFEEIVKTDISYTYICCPWIKQEENDGQYRVFAQVLPQDAKWDNKAGHIADFVEKEIAEHKYGRVLLGISSK